VRALHIVAGRLYGGVETQLVTRAKFRSSCPEMEPEFALCFDGKLRERLLEADVPVHPLGPTRVRHPLSILRARRRLRRIVETRAIDVLSCHMPWALAAFGPVARSTGIPLVFWMHGPATGRHWVERWARLTRPDLAICNSSATAQTLPVLYPDLPAEVIFPPVAPPPTGFTIEGRRDTRRELETPPDAIVIAQVCRMEPWKGHRLHLDALSRLRDLPGWRCWMIGGAQRRDELLYEAELRALAQSFGIADRVRFLGERQDVPRLLHAADIYCQPNTGPEPFGIAVVEALYAGLPVVTSAMGGALEIIDPEVGFLTEPSPDAVAAALKQLIEDGRLRSSLGAAGPARARRLADPGVQIVHLKQVLDDLIARHGREHATVAALWGRGAG
jgi:glycosyltransferase involved in cell wall biosynthesis